MQIVIDIPEESFKAIKNKHFAFHDDINDLFHWIANGTPLPKGHGRIIDIAQLEYLAALNQAVHGHITWQEAIKRIKASAPTIIEADKAESEEV